MWTCQSRIWGVVGGRRRRVWTLAKLVEGRNPLGELVGNYSVSQPPPQGYLNFFIFLQTVKNF